MNKQFERIFLYRSCTIYFDALHHCRGHLTLVFLLWNLKNWLLYLFLM